MSIPVPLRKQLEKLPRTGIWQAGAAQKRDGTWGAFVLHGDGAPRATADQPQPLDGSAWGKVLFAAMAKPLEPLTACVPRTVRVADEALAAQLQPVLAPLKVTVAVEPTPNLQQTARAVRASSKPVLHVVPDAERAFFEAAAAFAELAPWDGFDAEPEFQFATGAGTWGRAIAVLMGGNRTTFGVSVFAADSDLDGMRDKTELQNNWMVELLSSSQASAGLVRRASQRAYPLFSPDWFPQPNVRDPATWRFLPAGPSEMAVLTTVMAGIVAWFNAVDAGETFEEQGRHVQFGDRDGEIWLRNAAYCGYQEPIWDDEDGQFPEAPLGPPLLPPEAAEFSIDADTGAPKVRFAVTLAQLKDLQDCLLFKRATPFCDEDTGALGVELWRWSAGKSIEPVHLWQAVAPPTVDAAWLRAAANFDADVDVEFAVSDSEIPANLQARVAAVFWESLDAWRAFLDLPLTEDCPDSGMVSLEAARMVCEPAPQLHLLAASAADADTARAKLATVSTVDAVRVYHDCSEDPYDDLLLGAYHASGAIDSVVQVCDATEHDPAWAEAVRANGHRAECLIFVAAADGSWPRQPHCALHLTMGRVWQRQDPNCPDADDDEGEDDADGEDE